jgi:hypothetical protein
MEQRKESTDKLDRRKVVTELKSKYEPERDKLMKHLTHVCDPVERQEIINQLVKSVPW